MAHAEPAQSELGIGVVDRVDPELVALPAPSRAPRYGTLTIMALVVAASLLFVASLRLDIAYFFAPDVPVDLGEATDLDRRRLASNAFTTLRGTPMASGTVTYERVLGGESFVVFPLAGQREVFVQVRTVAGDDGGDLARSEFTGRLVTFGALGSRADAVRAYYADEMDMPVTRETFVLLADEPPGSYLWALGLGGLCLLFVLVNAFLLWRWFRPLRVEALPGT